MRYQELLNQKAAANICDSMVSINTVKPHFQCSFPISRVRKSNTNITKKIIEVSWCRNIDQYSQ